MLSRASITRVAACLALAVASLSLDACRTVEIEPLKLEGNLLTVDNRSSHDWTDVDIAINRYFHVGTARIQAGGRAQVTLDSFVGGFGRCFNYRQIQITDLRLTAKLPDGKRLELNKEFTVGGLAGALGRKPRWPG